MGNQSTETIHPNYCEVRKVLEARSKTRASCLSGVSRHLVIVKVHGLRPRTLTCFSVSRHPAQNLTLGFDIYIYIYYTKFADNLETSKGLKRKSLKVAHDEQLYKALYAWFIQHSSFWSHSSRESKNFTASYTQIPQVATLELRQDCLRNSKIVMEFEI